VQYTQHTSPNLMNQVEEGLFISELAYWFFHAQKLNDAH